MSNDTNTTPAPGPKVVQTRPAGPDHQVVTVEGGPGTYRRRPCGGCPWVVDNDGSFPADAFRHSARTAYDLAREKFACHEMGTDKPMTCAGFLLRGAEHNLAVRMAVMAGDLDPDQVRDDGRTLHKSYRDMAIANGVDPDDPTLGPCRS